MTDYWRPALTQEYRESLEKFLEKHPELPFNEPKELIKFCTDRFVTDVETNYQEVEEAKQKLNELQEDLG